MKKKHTTPVENLHHMGHGNAKQTQDAFDTTGIPTAPLMAESDLDKGTVPSGTQKLRSVLNNQPDMANHPQEA